MNKLIITILLVLAFGSSVFAAKGSSGSGFVLAPALMYTMDNVKFSATSKSDSTRLTLDGRVGWKFANPLYVGGMYFIDNTATQPAAGTSGKSEFNGYAASVGLITDGFFLIGHYIIGTEWKDKTAGSTTETTYSEGSGFQADIGYRFNLGSKVAIAPELHYRSLAYKKSKTNLQSTTQTADVTYSGLLPFIGIWVTF